MQFKNSPDKSPVTHLFVYGKLKRTFSNPYAQLLRNKCIFTGEGFTYGKLYKVSDYPALVVSSEGKVYGEIFEINNLEILKTLDTFEEAWPLYPADSAEYKRLAITVFMPDKEIECWAYIYNWPVNESSFIESGVF